MIDDYSNDNSFDIANKIAENDKRIKLYKNKGNKGIIHSLRLGLKKCSGNYITRMDSDDIMHEDKIKELLNSLKKKGKGYVSTSKVKYFSKKGVGLGYKKYENWLNKMMEYNDNYDHIYKECVIPSPNWMIHIDDLLNCSAFDSEIYPEDYDLVFRFYKNNIKIIPSQKNTT
jgi:glycosyltransferase involved in cell wall biosynthesis